MSRCGKANSDSNDGKSTGRKSPIAEGRRAGCSPPWSGLLQFDYQDIATSRSQRAIEGIVSTAELTTCFCCPCIKPSILRWTTDRPLGIEALQGNTRIGMGKAYLPIRAVRCIAHDFVLIGVLDDIRGDSCRHTYRSRIGAVSQPRGMRVKRLYA